MRQATPSPQRRLQKPTLRQGLRRLGYRIRPSERRPARFWALTSTVAAHIAVLTALFWPYAALRLPQVRPSLAPIEVTLLAKPPVLPVAQKVAVISPQSAIEPIVLPVIAATPAAARAASPDNSDLLSDSQLAGAVSAGEGGGGGGCDTARAVQQALRRDPLVRAAVEDAHRLGKAIMLWNGDWVQSSGQDGKGLSAVREAITWEVAFAPQACRNQRVHGLVLLSLGDGGTRFAIGSGDWRWSDLLGVR